LTSCCWERVGLARRCICACAGEEEDAYEEEDASTLHLCVRRCLVRARALSMCVCVCVFVCFCVCDSLFLSLSLSQYSDPV